MSHHRMRILVIVIPCLALLLSVYLAKSDIPTRATGPHLLLSLKSGPPKSSVKLSGTSYGINEPVNITFDITQVGTANTESTGAFTIIITIPSSALPGSHTIQAKGRKSSFFAQATFLVQTDWSSYGFGPEHRGLNPYENVLTPTNVSQLALDWSYTTGGGIISSPAVANGVLYVGSDDHKVYALNATT